MSLFARAKKAKENKKGFTLVELIVVIVIIAILAAILVPSILKWIDKSRNSKILSDARTAYVTTQIFVAEKFEKNVAYTDASIMSEVNAEIGGDTTGTPPTKGVTELTLKTDGNIDTFTYKDESGKWTQYNKATGWSEPTK